mmetsp:Transcript_21464/g.46638  ORF Transcript_21464/g.46638 Transcript_21464/m.46638 type:complete len:661 (+) Transcript_21464:51-2033(+)
MATPSTEESYNNAVAALLSPVHQATTPAAIQAAAARRINTLHDMHTYLHRLGLNLNDKSNATPPSDGNNNDGHHVPSLIVHVTGTKGKGSTLALCESILRNAHGLNTGMFTSPHLVSIRERIRINGVPVSKKVFARVYWTVRRGLEQFQDGGDAQTTTAGNHSIVKGDAALPPPPVLPGYFRMLTLMALYTFCHHQNPKIDAILLEVGMGGRYDATNVFEPHPLAKTPSSSCPSQKRLLVRGVTLIDYDHIRVLGSTLKQIAWEKGGIFVHNKLENIGMGDGGYDIFLTDNASTKDQNKHESNHQEENDEVQSSPIVYASGNNTPEVLSVFDQIASINDCHLQVVHDSSLESFPDIGLQGDHQRSNAALALALCRYAMEKYHRLQSTSSLSHEKLQDALAKTFWPGRCHTVPFPCQTSDNTTDSHGLELSMNLRCDGAHTPISINACIEWFRKVSTASTAPSSASKRVHRVLVFNCSHERNPLPLLFSLYQSNLFDSIYFCRADFERPSAVPKRLEDGWAKDPLGNIEHVKGGEIAVTLESMCGALSTTSHLNPSSLCASTWQETLANVWKVFDMYQRLTNMHFLQPSVEVTTGLNVKDALTAIQKEVVSMTNNHVGDITIATDAKRVLIEVCVTGSLYMVGSALDAAGWEEGEAPGDIC